MPTTGASHPMLMTDAGHPAPTTDADHSVPSTGVDSSTLRADAGRFLRFTLVGAINTVLTGALLLLIASWVAVDVAYTIVYAIGLAFTVSVTSRFVFRRRPTARTTTRFVVWYGTVYLVGVAVVRVAGAQVHSSHLLTTVAVLAVTVPLNFLGGRQIFGTGAPGEP
jgi:putative flippase GtrA